MAAVTTATPTIPAHFASLAAALESGDRELVVRTFDEMSEELLGIAERAPSNELWAFLLDLHESFYSKARALKAVSA